MTREPRICSFRECTRADFSAVLFHRKDLVTGFISSHYVGRYRVYSECIVCRGMKSPLKRVASCQIMNHAYNINRIFLRKIL